MKQYLKNNFSAILLGVSIGLVYSISLHFVSDLICKILLIKYK